MTGSLETLRTVNPGSDLAAAGVNSNISTGQILTCLAKSCSTSLQALPTDGLRHEESSRGAGPGQHTKGRRLLTRQEQISDGGVPTAWGMEGSAAAAKLVPEMLEPPRPPSLAPWAAATRSPPCPGEQVRAVPCT